MNRKHFLSTLLTTSVGVTTLSSFASSGFSELPDKPEHRLPPYLQPGDTIGITCPAGYIKREDIMPAIRLLESWGFSVRIGKTVGARDYTFGGTDAERAADLQSMLNDDRIKAILCARGGYGSARIIDQISFSHFQHHPKWVIGFSDITVLHCHINRHFGIGTLHSKMCNSFPDDFSKAEPIVQDTIMSIYQALTGKKMKYTAPADIHNRRGEAKGVLIGGNLSIIQGMCGTNSEIVTTGKLLFLEETGEYLYNLDRLMGTLHRAHKLDNLAGLIIGGFTKIKADDPGEEFGRSVYDIVMEKVKDFKYPVCFNFPVGHQKNNYALKCGAMHTLNVTTSGTTLKE
ncbi:LD-carboxypeptidase [Chitinophaga silvatica]|uniref:LD-carboxypeptidase n=1 Tax=Chitinophaga silvatica TaxID=2282649 RepID=A0A3E1YDT7_9BACT|nr:LD-carboxypeptidase [Chitinophaga silvatica]RFS24634.1 LD-carboxypeptidase [Chitinophaga silvatica]